jgi:hypothetical protein
MLTTNKNEAGFTAASLPDGLITASNYDPWIVQPALGSSRASTFLSAPYYNPNNPNLVQPYDNDEDLYKQVIDRSGTDQMWKCAGWDFAKRWTGAGGKIWVGEFELGATYAGSEGLPYCTNKGRVCHQDEIYILVMCLYLHYLPPADVFV